jgi:hypothetical protein
MTKLIMLLGIAFLATLAVATAAQAEYRQTVEELLQRCDAQEASQSGSIDLAICVSYITGVANMMSMTGASLPNLDRKTATLLGEFSICLPQPQPSYGAMVQTFRISARRHPARWGQRQLIGVLFALHETWPCKQ